MSNEIIALAAWMGFAVASVGGGCALGSCTCRVHRAMTGAAWAAVTLSMVATFLWLGQPHHASAFSVAAADGQMPAMPITAFGE